MPLIFAIDEIIFEGIETPETVDTFGTKQAHVVHEFPGGLRTIRNLGALPIGMRWHGILSGPTAFDRKVELERKAATGQQVTLSYGPFAWLGEVVRFETHPRHQFYIPYVLDFEPTEDLSGVTQGQQSGPSSEAQLYGQQSALGAQQTGTAAPLPAAAGGVTIESITTQ